LEYLKRGQGGRMRADDFFTSRHCAAGDSDRHGLVRTACGSRGEGVDDQMYAHGVVIAVHMPEHLFDLY